ncbi:MAG: ABC transporter permease [Bacilli bacterium]|nr:ABC transporter permease [Bacilli bacterium]
MLKNFFKENDFIRISRRMEIPTWKKWVFKIAGVLAGFLFAAIVVSFISPGSFFKFFESLIVGNFTTVRKLLVLFEEVAILFLISCALAPAFKMKFWNIGAEGQVLMACLGTVIGMFFIAPNVPNAVALIIELLLAVTFGVVWSLIPTLFKAFFNTNETLFTLMMNYIAKGIVALMITLWIKNGSGVIPVLEYGRLPRIGGQNYIINIIVAVVIGVIFAFYMMRSKQGFEISVLGGSRNTAKYVGIDVKKVLIRTMIITGVICGIVGFLLVAGASYSMNENTVSGRGFTAILVCWLAGFNIPEMAGVSFLVAFMKYGAREVESSLHVGGSFVDIVVGVFFFVVIASNFFITNQVKINFKAFKKKKKEVIE